MTDKPISRRHALKMLAVTSLAGATGLFPRTGFGARQKTARPNIVFVLTDDHRWDHMGCAGHPFLKTPHMDQLASEGVLFENAFVTTSLCSPSRASFLTGQYAHTHGVKNNLTPWRNENITFLEPLHDAGYDTAFIGKWHMPGRLPHLRGVDEFVTFTVQGGQGRYYDCPLIVNGRETKPNKPYITEELTDRAIAFAAQHRRNPFCLYLSLKAAHHDWRPPKDLTGLYTDEKLPLADEADTWVTMTNGGIWAGTAGPLQYHYRNYCRVLTSVDRQVGRLLNSLDKQGVTDETVVIYAGDNGYFWGEHRLIDKRWAYEESIRVPFIVRAPNIISDPGRRAGQMVLNIDLAPTLLEVAGLKPGPAMAGRSILPILKNPQTPGRDAWLYEYFVDFPYNVPGIHAVHTRDHIYIEYQGRRPPELYDLKTDPKQTQNLVGGVDERELARFQQMLATLKQGGRL